MRLQAAVDEVFEGHVDYFERAIQEAVDDGEAEPGNVRERARSVLALLEGALLVAKVANDPDRFGEIVRSVPTVARSDAA